jgi:hypothetical protein
MLTNLYCISLVFGVLGGFLKQWHSWYGNSVGLVPQGNMDQELLKKQLEQAATAALYQQLQIRFQHMNR